MPNLLHVDKLTTRSQKLRCFDVKPSPSKTYTDLSQASSVNYQLFDDLYEKYFQQQIMKQRQKKESIYHTLEQVQQQSSKLKQKIQTLRKKAHQVYDEIKELWRKIFQLTQQIEMLQQEQKVEEIHVAKRYRLTKERLAIEDLINQKQKIIPEIDEQISPLQLAYSQKLIIEQSYYSQLHTTKEQLHMLIIKSCRSPYQKYLE